MAVIQLAQALTLSPGVSPVCLPGPGLTSDNVPALVTGWGTLASGGDQPRVLQVSEVKKYSFAGRGSFSVEAKALIWYFIFGIWYSNFGIWYFIFCIWYFIFGISYSVFGISLKTLVEAF